MKVLCKIIHKTTIILIILGFFINSFANLPFKKIQAQLGNLESNEVILNEEYGDEEDILIEEIEEMRNTNSKVFKTNSGKYEYHYYNNIIHSYDEEIGFTEIDSSFEEISNEYSSNSLKYNVKVPKKITENKKIKLSYENTKLELKYNDIYKQTGTIISNENNDISSLNHLIGTVKYENIYDNVDLELITNSTSLKENVILNNFIDNFSFSYNISLTNLKLVNENNYINFYDNNEKLIYQINPYFMFDKNNNISYDLIVEIEEIKKNNYQITVIPDNTFLLNASYPVTIDPTITYRYNLIDDYIQIKNFKKGNITSNYQNYVSVTKFIDISTNENMSEVSIMKLDVSQLPKNVMYSSAELRMYSYSDCCKTEDICLYNITSSNFDFNSVKGTTSYYKSYITKQEKLTTNWYSFDILNAIKGDNDDILYLEFSGEKLSRNDVQAKFEGFDNYSYGPMLVFKYYETSGIKDYWTYHSTSLGNAGTMYINDFSGNLVVERVDYENPGERMSFNIVQYYNSFESDVNIGYGNGWRFNYCDFIKNFTSLVGVNSNDYYTHVDGTGHKSYYEFQRQLNPNIASSGLYYCEDGDDSIIEIGASENDYYRRIVDGEYVYKYNTYGELILIAKNDSSFTETAIFIEYTELSNNQRVISKISDVVRNSATFYYNEDNLLEEIEIKRKKIEDEVSIYEVAYRIFYTYDDENNLKRVSKTAKDSSKIQTEVVYTYNDNNKLSVMKNELSRSLNNSKEEIYFWYDSNNEKVDRYQYEIYDLNIGLYVEGFPYVDIIYETYKTIFESSDGHKSYYSFDRYGHTINVYDNDGYAKFYKYEFDNENNFLNNKLLEESESVYYKYNKITNHGFENYDSNNSIIGWTTSGNVTLNSINKLFGEYSLELTSSTSYASQTVQLYGNTTYKLSSFIKVKSIDDYVSGGAYIDITAQNSNGNIITSQTEYIAPNDEFEEYIKEFTVGGYDYYPYLVTITLRTSINTNVYFDNVQFITSINDCRYNMLEDNSFENSYITSNSKWTGGQTVECEPSEAFGRYNRYIPSKSILKQVLDINILQGTKISFGGFALTNGNKTSIRVRFYNLETDTYSDYYVINYNKEVSGYQFLMDNVEVTLEGGCHQIEYEVINNGNIGIYVDNLILMQDVFTNQYEYNVVGKPSKKLTPEEIIEFIRDSGTNRKIQQIRIEKNDTLTLVNYEESTTQKTVNIDGSINNITTTTYCNNEVVPNATVVGTFETKYFTTTTEYSHSSQFISKTTDEFNNETKYEYDYLSGLLTKVTDAKNIDTTYEYDYYERITKITKDSNVIEYTYNNNGQIEKVRTGNDTLYIEYYFEYNEYLDIKKISSSSNTTEGYKTIIEYQYYLKDGLYTGEIEKIINANGSYILYVYDSNLRVIEVWKKQQNQTEEVLITKYTYNESNNVSVFYDGRTNTTYFYSYDLKGNLMQIIDSDQNKILYTYDNNSNVTKIEYTIDGETNIIYYGYDTEGNMNAVISNDIATYYEESQDPLGRYFEKTVKTNQDQPILSYNYTYCVSTNTSLSEDTNVSNLDSTRLNTEEIIIGNTKYITSYTYDSLGNIITKIQSKVNTSNNQIIEERKYCYTYDNLNQLIEEEVYKNTTLILCCNYTYDILGNITFIQRSTKLEEYQNLPSNMAYFYEDTQNKTKLTKYIIDGETYNLTYDTYNNLTNLNNYDITFIEGKITSLSVQNTDQVRYTYDATGRRIKKEIYNQNTQTYDVINYVYLNDVLIKEIHSDKTITYILDDTGVIGFKVKTSTTEDTYYYIKNTQQDIISIVNENFVEVANYIYDAYGNIVNINEVNQNEIAKLNPYRYRSYYYDTETNYYYLNARYYSPEIGRFLTSDNVEYLNFLSNNGTNLYCYCSNNSIMGYDPTGNWTFSFSISLNLSFIVGYSISIGYAVDSNDSNIIYYSYSNPSDENAKTIGLLSAGISANFGFTNAESVDSLEGYLSTVGGDLGPIGIDVMSDNFSSNDYPEGSISGIQVAIGGALGYDAHMGQSNTVVLKKIGKV